MRDDMLARTAVGTLLALLAGCGGGSAPGGTENGGSIAPAGANPDVDAPEPDTAESDEARTGVFVDSPVAGLSWATETRDGVTGADGRFDYLPGETVTFSIGALAFPAVDAAERLTPIDLAREADDTERFAVNVARLLQTLDADGDPGNGIELVAGAAQASADIDFDVDVERFDGDPAVSALIASAGVERDALVSEERAREHFGLALSEVGSPGATAAIAGFWELAPLDRQESVTDAGYYDFRETYYDISDDGEWRVITAAHEDGSTCFLVDHHTLTPLGGARYLASSVERGGMRGMDIEVENDHLVTEPRSRESGDVYGHTAANRTARAASGVTPESLSICSGASLQRPPPGAGITADIAGFWELAGEDGAPSYYHVSSSGSAEQLLPREEFGPAPDYVRSVCHESVEFMLSIGGGGSFDGSRVTSPWYDRSRTFRLDGDELIVGARAEEDGFGYTSENALARSEATPASVRRCGADADRHPIDEVAGLWRNADDGLYGRYVRIDRHGEMIGYDPGLGGRDCFVETRSTLASVGGLDFVRQLPDGTERTLRMEPGGERLVIADVDANGDATPVRWLESVVGIDPQTFSLCRVIVTPEDLRKIEPLVGIWSRTTYEYEGPYGPDGATIPYSTRSDYWTIGSNGLVERTELVTELLDRYDGKAEYRTCRGHVYGDPAQLEVVGGEAYRIGGEAMTLARDGDTLQVTNAYETAIYHSADVDPTSVESCYSDPDRHPAEEAQGLWLLEPFEPGEAGAFLLLSDYQSYVFRPGLQTDGSCDGTLAMRAETLASGQLLFSATDRSGEDIAGIGRFALVDGELEVALESADDAFPLVDGRYPRVRGIDVQELHYRNGCY